MFLQLLASGILLGGVYALLSIGLSLILGVSKFINFAHGEFVMIGTYLAYVCYKAFGLSPYLSWPLVTIGAVLFGLIIFFIIKRTIGGSSLNHILLSLGISMILQNVILMLFKSDVKSIPATFGTSIKIGSIYLSIEMIISFVIAILTTMALIYVINHTNFGRSMKAVGQNRVAAELMGISVSKVDLYAFLLGTVTAALAGSLLMTLYPTQPTIGAQYNIIAWIIVILGGLGHLQGALISGIVIGVTETISGYYLGSDMRQVVYFIIFVVIVIVKPEGLSTHINMKKPKTKKVETT